VSAPETSSKIFLVMHPDLRRAPRVRAFCDFVIAEIDAFSRCGAAGLTPRRGERDALAVMLSGGRETARAGCDVASLAEDRPVRYTGASRIKSV
jgi:hypothetical protein